MGRLAAERDFDWPITAVSGPKSQHIFHDLFIKAQKDAGFGSRFASDLCLHSFQPSRCMFNGFPQSFSFFDADPGIRSRSFFASLSPCSLCLTPYMT